MLPFHIKNFLFLVVVYLLSLLPAGKSLACEDPNLDLVPVDVEFTLCDGTLSRGRLTNCEKDLEENCLVENEFIVVDKQNLLAKNIRNGVIISGVRGNFPSNQSPFDTEIEKYLGDYTSILNSGAYVFWDNVGEKHVISVKVNETFIPQNSNRIIINDLTLYKSAIIPNDADLKEENIKVNVKLFNVNGIGFADALVLDEWDIRSGITLKEKTGKLKSSCRNLANLSAYDGSNLFDGSNAPLLTNAITPPAPNSVANWWDTIDFDTEAAGVNSPAVLPADSPWGADSDQFICDDRNWEAGGSDSGDVTGFCNDLADECIMRDRLTNIQWTEDLGINNWADAMRYCDSLNSSGFGGYNSRWRLPTGKELVTAYLSGIEYLETTGGELGIFTHNFIYLENVWSATTYSAGGLTEYAASLLPGFGVLGAHGKSTASDTYGSETYTKHTYCVRDFLP